VTSIVLGRKALPARGCDVASRPSAKSAKIPGGAPDHQISGTKKSWLLRRVSGIIRTALTLAGRGFLGGKERHRARNGFYFPGSLVQQAVCHNSVELSCHCVARVRAYSTISREASLFAPVPSAAIVR